MSSGTEFDLDLDDMDLEREGGYSNPAPGRYHGEVNAYCEKDPQCGKMTFDVEVLAGTTPNQEGKTTRFFFDLPNADYDEKRNRVIKSKIFGMACALGLATLEEAKKAKEQRRPLKIDWSLAVGRQLCFEVEANEKTKSGISIKDWCYWSLTSTKAAGIPLNQGKLATQGDAAADPFGDVF
jgi:hypothetical protein